jgi:hypothetical protein
MTDQPTTTLTVLPPQVTEMQRLPQLLEKNIPILNKRKGKAHAALDEIPEKITSKDQAEEAIAILAAVRDVYNANKDMRMEMTNITDEFKDMVMEFERDFNPDAKAKSRYNEKRKVVEAWQQEEHDRVQREKQEAASRKELENLKVDYRAKMLENLTNMVINGTKKVDSGSKDYFEASVVDNFDARAEQYKSQKPKLKQSDYDAAFMRPVDPIGSKNMELMSKEDYIRYVVEVQQEETFDKWNTKFIESISPIINAWRARIHDLKKNLLEVEELRKKDVDAATALQETQKAEVQKQVETRQEQLDVFAQQNKEKIQEESDMQKMSNSFAEQGVVQQAGDAGKTKYVLKFIDPKLAPKGFLEIMYHVMASPEFQEAYPVFQKRDAKTKKLLTDDKGRPVYIEAVQWWIDFFLDVSKADITGTKVDQDAKITVRK